MLPDPSRRIPFSKEIKGGRLDVLDVLQPIDDEINKKYGTNEKPGRLRPGVAGALALHPHSSHGRCKRLFMRCALLNKFWILEVP